MTLIKPDLRYLSDSTHVLPTGASVYAEMWPGREDTTLAFVNNFYIVAPMWRSYTTELRERYTCLFYDLENQGGSSANAEPTPDAHARTLHELLTKLGRERVVLVGTSTSSLVARRYAELYPESLRALVLVGPSITPSNYLVRRATERALINSLKYGGTEALWDHLYSMVFSAAAMRDMGPAGYLGLRAAFTAIHRRDPMLANMSVAMKAADDFNTLTQLGVPVQLVLGSLDTLWPEHQIEEARAALAGVPHLDVERLHGAGHLPYMEDAEGFQQAVLRFVEKAVAA